MSGSSRAAIPAAPDAGRRKASLAIWYLHHEPGAIGRREEPCVSTWKGLYYRYDGPLPKHRLDRAIEPEFLPRSLNDAHRVLNVNSAAPRHVVEKLVMCLRQVWHPDRGSADERSLRTMKLQQINAAWDIVSGKRPAGGDSASDR